MSTSNDTELGYCPGCGTMLDRDQLLIRYEDPAGQISVWAGCRWCDEVVQPKSNDG